MLGLCCYEGQPGKSQSTNELHQQSQQAPAQLLALPASFSRTHIMAALKRLSKELADIKQDPVPDVIAGPVGDDIFTWTATIMGPANSPYSEGCFSIRIQ